MPLPEVQNLIDTRLAQKISQLPGVGLVTLSAVSGRGARAGQSARARVQRLAWRDVRLAIANANVNQAKGRIRRPEPPYTI